MKGNAGAIKNRTFESILTAYGNGQIEIQGSDDTEAIHNNIYCSGEVRVFAACTGGAISPNVGYGEKMLKFQDNNMVCKRYNAVSGGHIGSGYQGAEYYPGDTAGTVETSTYSWYK